eukprot:c25580_g1_i1 orf=658-957(+)
MLCCSSDFTSSSFSLYNVPSLLYFATNSRLHYKFIPMVLEQILHPTLHSSFAFACWGQSFYWKLPNLDCELTGCYLLGCTDTSPQLLLKWPPSSPSNIY